MLMNELDVALGAGTDCSFDPCAEEHEDIEWSLMALENDSMPRRKGKCLGRSHQQPKRLRNASDAVRKGYQTNSMN